MELIEHIEQQISATKLPLVAITMAAVPCPDTPVILTLHWHGFISEKIANIEGAQPVRYTAIPSSALQLNERWREVEALDRGVLEAAWELGAWDVTRAEKPSCMRLGAPSAEAMECLQAFGASPFGAGDHVVADAPDADELISVAAKRGYLTWMFRPTHGGLWRGVSEDATLRPDGTRTTLSARTDCAGSSRGPSHAIPARGNRRR